MFTNVDIQYPYADIDIKSKLVVEEAIRYSWIDLISHPEEYDIDLNTAIENKISEALQQKLENLKTNRALEGFNEDFFTIIPRSENLRNYNGQSLDKQPDFVIRPSKRAAGTNPLQYGIFVECKPVDDNHTIGQKYCMDGVIRYVRGDYAWAMPSGLMLAYVRNNRTIPEDLKSYLKGDYNLSCNVIQLPEKCNETTNSNPAVYVTKHDRTWIHPTHNRYPGDITLRHLWLKVPTSEG